MTKTPDDLLERAAQWEREAAVTLSQARVAEWLAFEGLPPATFMPHEGAIRSDLRCPHALDDCYAGHHGDKPGLFTPLYGDEELDEAIKVLRCSPSPSVAAKTTTVRAIAHDADALWYQLYLLGPHDVACDYEMGDGLATKLPATELLRPLAERLLGFLCGDDRIWAPKKRHKRPLAPPSDALWTLVIDEPMVYRRPEVGESL